MVEFSAAVMAPDDGYRDDAACQSAVEIGQDLRDAVDDVFEKPEGHDVEIARYLWESDHAGVFGQAVADEIADGSADDRRVPGEDEDGPGAVDEGEEDGKDKDLGIVEEYFPEKG